MQKRQLFYNATTTQSAPQCSDQLVADVVSAAVRGGGALQVHFAEQQFVAEVQLHHGSHADVVETMLCGLCSAVKWGCRRWCGPVVRCLVTFERIRRCLSMRRCSWRRRNRHRREGRWRHWRSTHRGSVHIEWIDVLSHIHCGQCERRLLTLQGDSTSLLTRGHNAGMTGALEVLWGAHRH